MRSFTAIVLLALSALTSLSAVFYYLSIGLAPKADIVYTYWIGFRWFEPVRAVSTLMHFAEAIPGEAYDFERRELASFNYPILAITGRIGHAIFGTNIVAAIGAAQALASVLGLIIAFAAFSRALCLSGAISIAISAMAILSFLPSPHPTDHLLRYEAIENAVNLVVLAAAPGEAFSPLSFWPKSSLAMIMLGALALRWSGRMAHSYVALATTLLFHITLGTLILVSFVIMDLSLRPKTVPWRPVWPLLIAAALALGTAGQSEIFSHTGHLPWLIASLLAIAGGGWAASPLIAPLATRLDLVDADTLAFTFATLAAVPAAMLLYALAYSGELWGPEASYLQVAARLLVLTVAVYSLFLGVRAQRWLEARKASEALLPIVLFASLATAYGAAGSWWWEGRTLYARMETLDERNLNEKTTQAYWLALRELTNVP